MPVGEGEFRVFLLCHLGHSLLSLLRSNVENNVYLLHFPLKLSGCSPIKHLLAVRSFISFFCYSLVSLIKPIQKHASPSSLSFSLCHGLTVLILTKFPRKGRVTLLKLLLPHSPSLFPTVESSELEVQPDCLPLWHHWSCCYH